MPRTRRRTLTVVNRKTALIVCIAGTLLARPTFALHLNAEASCNAPRVAGICNPYVPGTVGLPASNRGFIVVRTWPGGPADRAGICPGDVIVGFNGLSASSLSSDQILKQMVSSKPGQLSLTVERGKNLKQVELSRSRESRLIKLSMQKYSPFDGFSSGLIRVPLDENKNEVKGLQDFEKRLAAHYGFRLVPGLGPVPIATPEKIVGELRELLSTADKYGSAVPTELGNFKCWTGAQLTALSNSKQVIVTVVVPNSPAYQSGLMPGDRIVEIDSRSLSGLGEYQLRAILDKLVAREAITAKVEEGDSQKTIKIEPKEAGEAWELNPMLELPPPLRRSPNNGYFVGAHVLFDCTNRSGMISRVDYPSPAFDAGLHPGDLIVSINGIRAQRLTRANIASILSRDAPSPVTFEVSRMGRHLAFRAVPATEAQELSKVGRKMTRLGPSALGCP